MIKEFNLNVEDVAKKLNLTEEEILNYLKNNQWFSGKKEVFLS